MIDHCSDPDRHDLDALFVEGVRRAACVLNRGTKTALPAACPCPHEAACRLEIASTLTFIEELRRRQRAKSGGH